jgi:hypothetical protein
MADQESLLLYAKLPPTLFVADPASSILRIEELQITGSCA